MYKRGKIAAVRAKERTNYFSISIIFFFFLSRDYTLAVKLSLLLQNSLPNTLALGEGDQRLVALANNKHIGDTGHESMASSILDVHNVKRTLVLLLVNNHAHSAVIVASSGNGKVSNVEFDEIADLSGLKIKHDGVIDFDVGVRVANSTSIVSGDVRDTSLSEFQSLDLAELVRGLLLADTVHHKTALGVVDKTEVLVSLGDVDDVHETHGVGLISAHFAVDLHQTVHEDGNHLFAGQGISAGNQKIID